jgi:hypothetical protein
MRIIIKAIAASLRDAGAAMALNVGSIWPKPRTAESFATSHLMPDAHDGHNQMKSAAPRPRWHKWTEPQAPFIRQWLELRHRGFWRYVMRQGLLYATLGAAVAISGHLALRPGVLERPWGLVDLIVVAGLAFGAVVATLGPALWHWCQLTVRRRWRQGLCPRCCYDVRASVEHGREHCPECGLPLGEVKSV